MIFVLVVYLLVDPLALSQVVIWRILEKALSALHYALFQVLYKVGVCRCGIIDVL